jgi:hypothetical protein
MFEMTYGDMFLFVWAVAATGYAWQMHERVRHLKSLLFGASMFVKRLVQDDNLRDQLRNVLSEDKDTEFKFGVGE